jgi:hypothetical protein
MDKIQGILDEILKDQMYDEMQSSQMVNDILEKVMEYLNSLQKPYKYITECFLSQRVGSGFTNFTSTFYDRTMDNVYHFYYPKDRMAGGQGKALIFALLTIFIISYTNLN